MKIRTNSFVRRQTPESKFSHFEGTFEELERLAEAHANEAKPGYRDGVKLIPVPPERFFCGVVKVQDDTELVARFEARKKDEDKFINVTAKGAKVPAVSVDIVVYSHETLAEDGDAEHDEGTWEIISVNANPTEAGLPMSPMAMARNLLHLPGGTAAEYTAKEFAEAIVFWASHAMCEG